MESLLDEERVAIGSKTTIEILDAPSGERLWSYPVEDRTITSIESLKKGAVADGRLVFSTHRDKYLASISTGGNCGGL